MPLFQMHVKRSLDQDQLFKKTVRLVLQKPISYHQLCHTNTPCQYVEIMTEGDHSISY